MKGFDVVISVGSVLGKEDSKTYSLLQCFLDVFVLHPLAGHMSLLWCSRQELQVLLFLLVVAPQRMLLGDPPLGLGALLPRVVSSRGLIYSVLWHRPDIFLLDVWRTLEIPYLLPQHETASVTVAT